MPETFAAFEVPVIPKPMGTPEARAAMGYSTTGHLTNRPLYPVDGGFVGADRGGMYWMKCFRLDVSAKPAKK